MSCQGNMANPTSSLLSQQLLCSRGSGVIHNLTEKRYRKKEKGTCFRVPASGSQSLCV